jgi:hypothetical protein
VRVNILRSSRGLGKEDWGRRSMVCFLVGVILPVSKKTAISNFHRKLSTFSLHTRNTAITLIKLYLEGNPVSVN